MKIQPNYSDLLTTLRTAREQAIGLSDHGLSDNIRDMIIEVDEKSRRDGGIRKAKLMTAQAIRAYGITLPDSQDVLDEPVIKQYLDEVAEKVAAQLEMEAGGV